MAMPRGLQFVALANMDRLMLKAMLGLLERHLSCAWVESTVAPVVVFADAEHPLGPAAIEKGRQSGLLTIAISLSEQALGHHLLRRPLQTRDLLNALNAVDATLREAKRRSDAELALRNSLQDGAGYTLTNDAHLLRRPGNLFDYLVKPGSRTIVDVRFATGKSVMFNHPGGEYASALSNTQLLTMAPQAVQETSHGSGQAAAEWSVARRVLGPRPLEELTWQIIIRYSEGKPLPSLPAGTNYKLSRLPRIPDALSPRQLSIAKLLTRSASDLPSIARACGAEPKEIIDFLNAAWACGLLIQQVSTAPSLAALSTGARWSATAAR